ncbi:hypothetical protein DPMN_016548 [Dreissena polymorpha]|uniref:Uncharacterized protein n=1 Tax=Dreissena polymorpha TaxID=45954 RepID=A0A9D4NBG3_DREPO|nr:hypothetical protein DPMN_016548 [Dreissena polymorpha]
MARLVWRYPGQIWHYDQAGLELPWSHMALRPGWSGVTLVKYGIMDWLVWSYPGHI